MKLSTANSVNIRRNTQTRRNTSRNMSVCMFHGVNMLLSSGHVTLTLCLDFELAEKKSRAIRGTEESEGNLNVKRRAESS